MNQKGFSILEILIVIIVFGLISAIVLKSFSSFRANIAIQTEVEDVISLLERARIQTVSSFNDEQYGVHFESNRFVLYTGDTFVEPEGTNEEFIIHNSLSITEINLNGGGDEILFTRLTGNTTEFGTIVLTAVSNASTSRTINIYQNGIIDIE